MPTMTFEECLVFVFDARSMTAREAFLALRSIGALRGDTVDFIQDTLKTHKAPWDDGLLFEVDPVKGGDYFRVRNRLEPKGKSALERVVAGYIGEEG